MKIFDSFTTEVTELLKNGAVGVIPTDTVYGVVARLEDPAAVERIYHVKDRDRTKRVGTILINDPLQVEHLVDPHDLLAAQVYWPGPVSIEMGVDDQLAYAHRGHGTVAIRLPAASNLAALLGRTGPLASSSANLEGMPTASTIEEAMHYFRDKVDFYVKGGDLSGSKPSRIIKINKDGSITEYR